MKGHRTNRALVILHRFIGFCRQVHVEPGQTSFETARNNVVTCGRVTIRIRQMYKYVYIGRGNEDN